MKEADKADIDCNLWATFLYLQLVLLSQVVIILYYMAHGLYIFVYFVWSATCKKRKGRDVVKQLEDFLTYN